MGRIRQDARRIAKQLGYLTVMPDIYERINSAATEYDVTRIMTTARNLMAKEDR